MASTAATPLLESGRSSAAQSSRAMRKAAFVVAGLCGVVLLSMVIFTKPVRTELLTSVSGAVKDAIVAQHNAYRCRHGITQGLMWADSLATIAQGWANTLANQNGCKMQHSNCDAAGNPTLADTGIKCAWGENIAWASCNKYYDSFPPAMVDQWYAEEANFKYGATPSDTSDAPWCIDATKKIGHFTQVVWKATTKIGCGAAECSSGGVIAVCAYDPAGNQLGQAMNDNVVPKVAGATCPAIATGTPSCDAPAPAAAAGCTVVNHGCTWNAKGCNGKTLAVTCLSSSRVAAASVPVSSNDFNWSSSTCATCKVCDGTTCFLST